MDLLLPRQLDATPSSGIDTWKNTSLLLLLLFSPLIIISYYNYLLFHAVVELLSIVIGTCAFVFAWHGQRYQQTSFFFIMGIALLCSSSLDLLHTLSYKGMGVFTDSGANPATQLWIAARYLQSIAFCAALTFMQRKVQPNLTIAVFSGITLIIIWSAFFSGLFPDCFIEGKGLTPFKKISELIISIFYVVSLFLLHRHRSQFCSRVYHLIAASILFAILAELAFIFYVHVHGFSNLAGHIFKLASFMFLYMGIIRTNLKDPLAMLFRDLQEKDQQLEKLVEERTVQLEQTITQLHKEIIEHQQTSLQLKETSIFLSESQTIAKVGGWKTNPITNMLYWSDELYRLLEYPVHEPISFDTCLKYFTPEDQPKIKGLLINSLEHNTPFQLDCRVTTHLGQYFWANLRCVGRLEGPNGSYLAGILQDITTHKQTEELLTIAKEAAESANRAKSERLATVSHELRTPLNGVLGALQLIEMTDLSDEQNEYLSIAIQSGFRELALVNDLLTLASLECSGLKIDSEPFNLLESILQTVEQHRQLPITKQHLTFSVQLESNLEQMVIGDSKRLGQIIGNLLQNAIKFTEQGGVTVEANIPSHDGNMLWLCLAVKDTGIGILQEDHKRVFSPFVQADMSHTRKFGGTGLGLSICKRLAEQMGGEITLTSQAGEGSCFTIKIPFALSKTGQLTDVATALIAPQTNRQQLSILAVEDDSVNLLTLKMALTKLGHTACGAKDGKEALALWDSRPFDIVLMDIQMPALDGRETLKYIRLKEQNTERHTPIIAVTAHAMEADRIRLLDEGFDGYLAKPFKFDELQDEMSRVVGSIQASNLH